MALAPVGLAVAARLLPPPARERVWLLHGWWRACHDAMARGAPQAAPARLAQIRRLTTRALAGEPTGEMAFDGLGAVALECRFSWAQTADVLTRFELDASGWRPRGEDELLGYCYLAGGAMAVLVVRAMGIAEDDGEMLDCASDLGVALELGRIARAVAACPPALPGDWLAQAGVSPSSHRLVRKAWARRLRQLAAPYVLSARYGAAHLPFRSRWAALSLVTGVKHSVMTDRSFTRMAGLLQALAHGPDERPDVPLSRARLAQSITPAAGASPVGAAGETAAPVH
jgi:phytoene synthase